MKPLSIFLLDDNEVFLYEFREKLTDWLTVHSSEQFETMCFADAGSMLRAAETQRVDLVISDIELADDKNSGIQAVEQLLKKWPDCAVVYLTAYLSYATDIYETKPLYFILKEEYEERIPKAMNRFFRYWQEQMQYISILSDGASTAVPIKKLVYCERKGRTIYLYLEDGRELPTQMSIKELYELLPKEQFSVCHRGFIVNHRFISGTKRMELTLFSGKVLPVGRSCCDSFRENYHNWLERYL